MTILSAPVYHLYMAQPLTPQQRIDATLKRRQTQAANRAAGTSVRQQRAAKAAAKSGQPFVAPTPQPAASVPPPFPSFRRRRARRQRFHAPNPTPQTPVFTTPKVSYRPLRLVALAALEAAFVQKLEDAGGVAALTDEIRHAFGRYKKIKALALGVTTNSAAQIEADSALRLATVELVKLAY